MSSVFKKIQDQAERAGIKKRTEESRDWFIDKLKNIRNISSKRILNDDTLITRNKPLLGRMFMFMYDPKTRDTLPYYDRFPLIIMIGPAKKGFYGLNLHYLHPRLRAVFFDELMERMTNKKFNENTRLKLSYELLKSTESMRAFRPCFKRYLFSQIKSKTVEVPADQWETAIFLPSDNFAKASKEKIWAISKRQYNRR